jgi:UDP-N-acetylglucosamine 2-epimerase (non-hydrolysing)
MKKKILIIFGTRPELIKIALLYRNLKENSNFSVKVCFSGQHKDLVKDLLVFFQIKLDYTIDIKRHKTLGGTCAKLLEKLNQVIIEDKPNMVVVQGDTSTAFFGSLAAFYNKVSVAHIEAGLRTFNKFSPFPEEINRKLITSIADVHFAPTQLAKTHLINEQVKNNRIIVTGNTVIDAFKFTTKKIINKLDVFKKNPVYKKLNKNKITILVTGHRRENFDEGIENLLKILKKIEISNKNIQVIYPVHPNPNVKNIVRNLDLNSKNFFIIEPLCYPDFIFFMNEADVIITDSGGIQEEACLLKKPVLVFRDQTERQEALNKGFIKLIGTKYQKMSSIITKELMKINKPLSSNFNLRSKTPYGDGNASQLIIRALEKKYLER